MNTMRSLICHLMLISLLFVSIEGAADMSKTGHAHSDHSSEQAELDALDKPVPDQDEDHCDRCCHGHTSGISCNLSGAPLSALDDTHRRGLQPFIKNYAQAPPTPPPNA